MVIKTIIKAIVLASYYIQYDDDEKKEKLQGPESISEAPVYGINRWEKRWGATSLQTL